jgi:hypothetical protein
LSSPLFVCGTLTIQETKRIVFLMIEILIGIITGFSFLKSFILLVAQVQPILDTFSNA